VTIEETVKSFIEDVNAEYGSDLAIDSQGGDGEISINWPGHGHIYIDSKTGEILGKTKLQGGLVDKLRGALGGNVPAVPGRGGQIRPASKAAQSLREIQDEEAAGAGRMGIDPTEIAGYTEVILKMSSAWGVSADASSDAIGKIGAAVKPADIVTLDDGEKIDIRRWL